MSQSVSFDHAAEFYDRTRGGLERGTRFAAVLDRLLPRRARVLEIGVGTGLVALPLTDLGHGVVGVDIARAMLAQAATRLPGCVTVADAARLPVASASCDAVLAVWVFHLVGDQDAVLAEVRRVLRPRGRLIVVGADATFEPDDITEAVGDMRLRLYRTKDLPATFAPRAVAAGFTEIDRTTTERWEHDASPNALADALERREMSSLWNLSDDDWNSIVQPVIDRLRALPQPDRPRRQAATHDILVFERSGPA